MGDFLPELADPEPIEDTLTVANIMADFEKKESKGDPKLRALLGGAYVKYIAPEHEELRVSFQRAQEQFKLEISWVQNLPREFLEGAP